MLGEYSPAIGLLSTASTLAAEGLSAAEIAATLQSMYAGITIATAVTTAQVARCKYLRKMIDDLSENSMTKCSCDDDTATITLKTAYWCGRALYRWWEMVECFAGGDAGHIDRQQKDYAKCVECRALGE